MSISKKIDEIRGSLGSGVQLVAVSKTFPTEAVAEAYATGQRQFGESRPQELKAKWEALPKDIEWHMIGHLQTNKVRMILPIVSLIESLNSRRLAETIEREAARIERTVDCLLEIQLSDEESKTGWDWSDLREFIEGGAFESMPHIRLRGVMGIATYSDSEAIVEADFRRLRSYFEELRKRFGGEFDTVSMGMSSDYKLAMECGSTSVRVGSYIFGGRSYAALPK
ncbi:MAG: YggS family pyridoxal phosphate-dependent enzyme [Rikenellaceae bacterium]